MREMPEDERKRIIEGLTDKKSGSCSDLSRPRSRKGELQCVPVQAAEI